MTKPQVQSEPKPPFPAQKLPKPGLEADMRPRPKYEAPRYRPAAKLTGKAALVTGGDSGIGRAVAVLFAREGADVAITALSEEKPDAEETKRVIEAAGRRCSVIQADLSEPDSCRSVIERTMSEFGQLDIPRQQRCASKPEEFDRRRRRGRVGSHVQDQRVRLLLAGESGASASDLRRVNHRHRI